MSRFLRMPVINSPRLVALCRGLQTKVSRPVVLRLQAVLLVSVVTERTAELPCEGRPRPRLPKPGKPSKNKTSHPDVILSWQLCKDGDHDDHHGPNFVGFLAWDPYNKL